jgi:hypothetical protein
MATVPMLGLLTDSRHTGQPGKMEEAQKPINTGL